MKVVCTGRRLEPIEETVAEIKSFGGEAFAMTCDSADRERVKEVVAKTVETYGTVDVVAILSFSYDRRHFLFLTNRSCFISLICFGNLVGCFGFLLMNG